MKIFICLFTLLAASSVQIDDIHVKLKLSSSLQLLKNLQLHLGNIRRASEATPEAFQVSPLILNSFTRSLVQLREWFEEAERESGTLWQFTRNDGDNISELIAGLEDFQAKARLFGSNRGQLPVKTENIMLTYQREIDNEVNKMLEMARKEPLLARTRLLDDNATLGPMINAALRKIDALENQVMTVKQENELLKSFVVEMSAHLTHQLSTSQNQLVKLILDMAPK